MHPCPDPTTCVFNFQSLHEQASHEPCISHAGPRKRTAGLLEALKGATRRILSSPIADFTPSSPPRLLNSLTDADLVTAWTVVEAVAADMQPKPSMSAQKRALAWAVADARGAVRTLEKSVADKVGLRLQTQAIKVRSKLAAADAYAESERARVRSEPPSDGTLTSLLAEIDSQLESAHQAAKDEVYGGFTELQEVLPSEDIPPTYYTAPTPLKESDIPPALAKRMSKEQADLLRTLDLSPSCLQPDNLPGVVSLLLDLMLNERSYRETCRREAQESRKAVQVEKARGEEDVAEADRWWGARCAELEQEKDELERKLEIAKRDLAQAQGGVAALHKVINETLAKHMPVDE